jgi:hypothetical protein
MGKNDEQPVRAIVDHLGTIKFERALVISFERISQSSERLCNVVERCEMPIKLLLVSLSVGILFSTGAYFIGTVSESRKKNHE